MSFVLITNSMRLVYVCMCDLPMPLVWPEYIHIHTLVRSDRCHDAQ